jgi:DNA helicase HerA-like ATPase
LEAGSFALGTELASRFANGGMVTGVPSRRDTRSTNNQTPSDAARLTRVVRGIRGADWGFVVRAWPKTADDILAQRTDLIHKLSALAPFARQNIQRTIQATQSRTDHASQAVSDVVGGLMVNRDVEYVVEMLELEIERLDEALALGGWQVAIHYGSADAASATQLGGLLQSVFSGPDSRPDRIRILPSTSGRIAHKLSEADFHTELSSAEVGLLMEIPREEAQGFRVTDYALFDIDAPRAGTGSRVGLGEIIRDGTPSGTPIHIPVEDLSKHALIVGVTGSGKTTTVSNILQQAWASGVPFLVAEPAKTEYRTLLAEPIKPGTALLPELRVYTVGNDRIAPFRLNPFEFDTLDAPVPSLLLTHIDVLKAVFNAAFVLYAPMPYVLELALHEVYEDRGWNLATGQNLRLTREDWTRRHQLTIFPTLTDLRRKVGVVTRRMGYEARIEQDVSAGLQARIDSLRVGSKGLMLDVPRGLGMSELLAKPTVLELESIGNDSERAFIMGLVFARICEYRRLQASGGHLGLGIQHVLVIEEAHRLLRNVSTDVDVESANLKAQAVETLVNMLSEVRRYGQGVILAEQVPRKLAPDAIKNTNLKVMHRIVAADDRATLAGSANMSEEQSRRLSTLVAGEAIVFAEGADHPYLVATADILAGRREKAPIDAQLAARANGYIHLDRFLTVPDYAKFGIPLSHFGGPDPVLLQTVLAFAPSDAFSKAWARIIMRTIHARTRLPDELTNLQRAFVNASPHLSAGRVTTAMRLALTFGAAQAVQDRANERSWTYSTADGLRQSLTRGLTLSAHPGQESAATAALDTFSRSYEAATRQELGPFPGCPSCPNPCFHRFDVVRLVTPTLRTGVTRSLTDSSLKTALTRYKAASTHVLRATAQWLSKELPRPHGIAYCAALTAAAASGLDEYQQDEFATQIAPHLL